MIAIEKKSHNISETLVEPCMLKAAGLVLQKTYIKKMALSDFTIKTPIDKLAKEVECQVSKKLPAFFSIPCDETSDISQLLQLLAYVRFN